MSRWLRLTGVVLAVSALAGTAGCALPTDGGSDGDGGGGLEVRYCEEDHRGDLNQARCYDEPDGGR
jgi:hypothetical protein